MAREVLNDKSEKNSATWISDMIALVFKKELMWEALEFEIDNASSSLFNSKQIIKILLHELKTLHCSQCKCSKNSNGNNDTKVEFETNKVEEMDEMKETSVISNDFQIEDLGETLSETIENIINDKPNDEMYDECEEESLSLELKSYLASEKDSKDHSNQLNNKTRPKKIYECKTCFKIFVTPSKLERHENIHTGKKMFQCEFCTKRFNQPNHLKDHLFRSFCTETESFKCNKTRTFSEDVAQIIESKKKKQSSSKRKLPSELEQEYLSRKYECQTCFKRFVTPSKLERHESVHTGRKIFQCETCEERFNQPNHLNEHLKRLSHKSEKPYACEVCSERFLIHPDLKIHEVMNHAENMPEQNSPSLQVVKRLIAKYHINKV